MTAVHTQQQNTPDPAKVFSAIAMIVSRRGDGNVRLSAVKSVQQERKAG